MDVRRQSNRQKIKGVFYGKKREIISGQVVGNSAVLRWWQVCVHVCLSFSFIFHSSGQCHLSLTHQTHCQGKNRMGRCWWRHTADCEVVTDGWPVYCMSVCVCVCVYVWFSRCSESWACQRATVTPLLLHYSQFTTKHPQKCVWTYLWGDSKMSMSFHPHYHDLKTFNGTFKTTNSFLWWMTSQLSCSLLLFTFSFQTLWI